METHITPLLEKRSKKILMVASCFLLCGILFATSCQKEEGRTPDKSVVNIKDARLIYATAESSLQSRFGSEYTLDPVWDKSVQVQQGKDHSAL